MSEQAALDVFARMAQGLMGLASGDWSRLVARAYVAVGNSNLEDQAFVEDERGGRRRLPATGWRSLAYELRSALCAPEGQDRVSVELVVERSGRFSALASFQLTQTFGSDSTKLATAHRLTLEPAPGTDAEPAPVAEVSPAPAPEADIAELVMRYRARYAELVGSPLRLKPPATEAEVAEVEAAIGAALPADLRALYATTGGSMEIGGILGGARLFPPAELVREWRAAGELFGDMDHEVVFDADPPGMIRRVPWNLRWITFGTWDDSNYLAVDLDPGPAGQVGQVIVIGRGHSDDEPVGYVARSVADMFTTMLRAIDEGRYEVDADSGLWITIPGADCVYGAHRASLSFNQGQQLTAELATTAGPDRIQELYLLDAPDLDLTALTDYSRLIALRVRRCGQVTIGAAAKLPLELLDINAHTADLSALAGHPTLRSLTAQNLENPIDLRWLRDIPNLETLDLSGSTLTGTKALATMPQLRSLTLDRDQWTQVITHPANIPPTLATATMTGGSLAEAVNLANQLAPKENTVRHFTGHIAGDTN